MPLLRVETAVEQQVKDPEQRVLPALMRSVAGLEHCHNAVAVGGEHLLRTHHSLQPAVALDFPLVGVVLHLPDDAVRQPAQGGLMQRRRELTGESFRLSMQTNAKMIVWLVVANEEPVVARALPHCITDQRRESIREEPIG